MRIPIHRVDAFTDRVFGGNPAAVCVLDRWLDDATMQSIAFENNLSETAFLVREGDAFRIRWFTPKTEVPLCGHATLASAWVLFHRRGVQGNELRLISKSGPLAVHRDGDLLALDFPAIPPTRGDVPAGVAEARGDVPDEILLRPHGVLSVYPNEARIRGLRPDLAALVRLGLRALVTAPGDDVDFVSRYFAPTIGIDEDPVTGAAHCALTPYWAARLGKTRLHARQVSARGGELFCELRGDRVSIAGKAAPYLEGFIDVP